MTVNEMLDMLSEELEAAKLGICIFFNLQYLIP